jgi:hypothetical protein
MKLSVRPALTTAPVVRGLDIDHDRRRGQRCIFLNRPVSLINRGKPVQINRATSLKPSNKLRPHMCAGRCTRYTPPTGIRNYEGVLIPKNRY